jgi:hypothetical protein
MTTEEVKAELTACLALQREIAAKQLELARRYKIVLDAERSTERKGPIAVRIGEELYRLVRLDSATDEMDQQMRICRELQGFYGGYRLTPIGEVYE